MAAAKMKTDRLSGLEEISKQARGDDTADTGDMPEMEADTSDAGTGDMDTTTTVDDMADAEVTEAPVVVDADTTEMPEPGNANQAEIDALRTQNAELIARLDELTAKIDGLSQAEVAEPESVDVQAQDDPLDAQLREVVQAIYEGDEDVLVAKLRAVIDSVKADPGALAGEVAQTMQSQQAQREAFNNTLANFAQKYGVAPDDQETWAHVEMLVTGIQAKEGLDFESALEKAGQEMSKYRVPIQSKEVAEDPKAALEAKAAAKDDIDIIGSAGSRATKPTDAAPMSMDDKLASLAGGRVGKYIG